MKQSEEKYITVDGVTYDITTGQVVSHTAKQKRTDLASSKHATVLDLREPGAIVAPQSAKVRRYSQPRQVSPQKRPHNPSAVIELPKRRRKKPLKTYFARGATKQRSKAMSEPARSYKQEEFLGFVLLKSFVAPSNIGLWQMSLVRTICSPQTWLLLTLPLILLQARVAQYLTLNQALKQAKDIVSPSNFDLLAWSFGVLIAAWLVGLIVRSLTTAAGVRVRVFEILKAKTAALPSLRVVSAHVARQALGYFFHAGFIVLISIIFVTGVIMVFQSNEAVILSSRYEIVLALFLIWCIALTFLYVKHWIQICVLSMSQHKKHVQLTSLRLLFAKPLSSLTTAIVGILANIFSYGIILALSLFVTNSFLQNPGRPSIGLLVVLAAVSLVVLTCLQYFSQSLWARHYYHIASSSLEAHQLLDTTQPKTQSLKPLIGVVIVSICLLMLYAVILFSYDSRIRGVLAEFHSYIPAQIEFAVPLAP